MPTKTPSRGVRAAFPRALCALVAALSLSSCFSALNPAWIAYHDALRERWPTIPAVIVVDRDSAAVAWERTAAAIQGWSDGPLSVVSPDAIASALPERGGDGVAFAYEARRTVRGDAVVIAVRAFVRIDGAVRRDDDAARSLAAVTAGLPPAPPQFLP